MELTAWLNTAKFILSRNLMRARLGVFTTLNFYEQSARCVHILHTKILYFMVTFRVLLFSSFFFPSQDGAQNFMSVEEDLRRPP